MAEKLTNGKTVSIRFSAPGAAQLEALAEAEGIEVSDYIRHLVAQDALKKKRLFDSLSVVFRNGANQATNSTHDSALQPLTASEFGAVE